LNLKADKDNSFSQIILPGMSRIAESELIINPEALSITLISGPKKLLALSLP
jgi:hypothetical protein